MDWQKVLQYLSSNTEIINQISIRKDVSCSNKRANPSEENIFFLLKMSQNLYVETNTSFDGFSSEVSSTLNKSKIFSVLDCQCTCMEYVIGFVVSVKKDQQNKVIKENATIIAYPSRNPFT